eukprot:11225081-Karenia_brevis.AAC.1
MATHFWSTSQQISILKVWAFAFLAMHHQCSLRDGRSQRSRRDGRHHQYSLMLISKMILSA